MAALAVVADAADAGSTDAAARLPDGRAARLLAETLPEMPGGLGVDGAGAAAGEVPMGYPASGLAPESVAPRRAIRLPSISSPYGWRRSTIGSHFHAGIDIPGRAGSPVLASADGVVERAGWAGGYGMMVELRHGTSLHTRYAHLSQILVEAGAFVRRGELLGRMGSTGRSTGNHLHFELRQGGRAVDPLPFLGRGSIAVGSARQWVIPDIPEQAIHLSDFARMRAQAMAAESTDVALGEDD